jgi:hypothetical protein
MGSEIDKTNDKEQPIRQRVLSNNASNSSNNTATYRDLVIFEERLRGNMTRLLKRKRKYESKNNRVILFRFHVTVIKHYNCSF